MAKIGKRTQQIRDGIDRNKLYALNEAVGLIKDRAKAKFDETVEVAMNLGVDPRHADQMVRGVVNLPNGTGRDVRVAVFARGDKAEEAKARIAKRLEAMRAEEEANASASLLDLGAAPPPLAPDHGDEDH